MGAEEADRSLQGGAGQVGGGEWGMGMDMGTWIAGCGWLWCWFLPILFYDMVCCAMLCCRSACSGRRRRRARSSTAAAAARRSLSNCSCSAPKGEVEVEGEGMFVCMSCWMGCQNSTMLIIAHQVYVCMYVCMYVFSGRHLFCRECLQRYAEQTVFGDGRSNLKCMDSSGSVPCGPSHAAAL